MFSKRNTLRIISGFIAIIICSLIWVNSQTPYVMPGVQAGPSYIIYREGTNYYAKNSYGLVEYSSSNASYVINKAIENSPYSKRIFIKAGEYEITNPIVLSYGMVIEGETYPSSGAELRASGSVNRIFDLDSSAWESTRAEIRTLRIVCFNTANGIVNALNGKAKYFTIDNIEIYDAYQYGIYFNSSEHLAITDSCVRMSSSSPANSYGIFIASTNNIDLRKNWVFSGAYNPNVLNVYISGGYNLNIENLVSASSKEGLRLSNVKGFHMHMTDFEGNDVGINLTHTSGWSRAGTIQDCYFSGLGTGDVNYIGININRCHNSSFRNLYIRDFYTPIKVSANIGDLEIIRIFTENTIESAKFTQNSGSSTGTSPLWVYHQLLGTPTTVICTSRTSTDQIGVTQRNSSHFCIEGHGSSSTIDWYAEYKP